MKHFLITDKRVQTCDIFVTFLLHFLNIVIKYFEKDPITDKGIFNLIFEDVDGISLLFIFLSNFIDYRICYEKMSEYMTDFNPTVCFDPNSNYIRNLNYFSADNIDDQIADLTKTDRKSTRLNSSHVSESRMPSSA